MSADLKRLPNNGMAPSNADIARHLREMADWIEEADASEIRVCIMVREYANGAIDRSICGHPQDCTRSAGVLLAAAMQAARGEE